jgi:Mce-associated membrane protein
MEGDAGTRRLNRTTDADDAPGESLAGDPTDVTEPSTQTPEPPAEERRSSRLSGAWVAGICAALVVGAAGLAAGGYLAWRSHERSVDIARIEAAALEAAKDCVAATHAPDVESMATSQAKIIECSTGDFAVQANLYSGMLVDAYRVADASVQVSDMRAAVERHHDDGVVDVLVAMRVKVTNTAAADQEHGYRLRAQMAPEDGTYKVARLDTVTS